MNTFKKLIIFLSLAITSLLIPLQVQAAGSNILDPACGDKTSPKYNSPPCIEARNSGNTNPVAGPNGVLQKAANLIAMVAGIVAVIMIVLGGISYATGGGTPAGQRSGDPNAAKNARARIINATIGLVVIFLAWEIVSYVIQHVISS